MATGTRVNCATGEVETFTLSEPSLDEAKASKWAAAKAKRDIQIDAGVTVPGIGTFDSDSVSRNNITGAVTMALIAQGAGAPFTIGWKLADNTVTTLDAAQMIGVGVAMGQYVAACHANAQAIGLAIQGAGDVETVEAIDIGAGWP